MISISPGHYGPRTGASGLIDEVTEAIKVSKEVTRILRASGITTNYIEDNVSKSQSANLTWLVAQHNKTSREFDVSIHFNSVPGKSNQGIGTEVLYVNPAVKGIAEQLSVALANASGLKNRGAKHRANLAFLNGTIKKALLIEVCFVNDSKDVELYQDNFEAICQAIAEELAKAVGKVVNPTNTNQSTNKKDEVSDWAKGAHEWAVTNKISDGKRPKDNVTRQEIWSMLQRMHNNLK